MFTYFLWIYWIIGGFCCIVMSQDDTMTRIIYKRKLVLGVFAGVVGLIIVCMAWRGTDSVIHGSHRYRRSANQDCYCGPGEFVYTPCTDTQSAICKPCPQGSFSSNTNEYTSCSDCTYISCPQNAFKESNCTPKTDIVCKCKPGYAAHYQQGGFLSCLRDCYCGPGEFVQTPCTDTQKAICEPCRSGTFSSSFTDDRSCSDCTNDKCPSGAFPQSNCTTKTDIICKCKPGFKAHNSHGDKLSCLKGDAPSTQISPKDQTSAETNDKNSKDKMHAYRIGVLMMSLFVLVNLYMV